MMNEIKCDCVAMLSGGKWNKVHEHSRRVYSAEGLCPTLHTCGGGNQEVKILEPMEVICLNTKTVEGKQPPQQDRVYSTDGVMAALTAELGGRFNIMEPNVLSPVRTEYGKKIRKQYESGEIAESRHSMTELQPRADGVSNTLTTVQKDNLILEPRIGAIRGRNPDNPTSRKSGEPTQQMLEIKTDGTSNTLTTVQKDNVVVEPMIIDPQGRLDKICTPQELCPTLRAQIHGNPPQAIEPMGGIRKLTPLEYFRLMGFFDVDFDRARWYSHEETAELLKKHPKRKFKRSADGRIERVSKSQLYKQAGNSIVVNVLEAIFREMME